MPHFMTIYQIFKSLLDNKLPNFEEYGAFKASVTTAEDCAYIFFFFFFFKGKKKGLTFHVNLLTSTLGSTLFAIHPAVFRCISEAL